ncbi:hypothetical protein HUO13_11955 [Saccharopolyspora erythraea]|uniref:hypothetical protein n=1 Tax=Saccharopolyspora erythraea TaxID=1836 RepID=UPI001BAD315A|nr:hypothetical protein [Saccharopolyspora erythraea]QUH01429.1 hypothetical protein HUO13_11955 [Saccharopolyspora erythraea]
MSDYKPEIGDRVTWTGFPNLNTRVGTVTRVSADSPTMVYVEADNGDEFLQAANTLRPVQDFKPGDRVRFIDAEGVGTVIPKPYWARGNPNGTATVYVKFDPGQRVLSIPIFVEARRLVQVAPFPFGWTDVGYTDETTPEPATCKFRDLDAGDTESLRIMSRDLVEELDETRARADRFERELQAMIVDRNSAAEMAYEQKARAEKAEAQRNDYAGQLADEVSVSTHLRTRAERAEDRVRYLEDLTGKLRTRAEKAEAELAECSEYFAVKAERDGWKARAEKAEAELSRVEELEDQNRVLKSDLAHARAAGDVLLRRSRELAELKAALRTLGEDGCRGDVECPASKHVEGCYASYNKPRRFRDAQGDVWEQQPNGFFRLAGERSKDRELSFVEEYCGPLTDITNE